jgi:hypothetical protein
MDDQGINREGGAVKARKPKSLFRFSLRLLLLLVALVAVSAATMRARYDLYRAQDQPLRQGMYDAIAILSAQRTHELSRLSDPDSAVRLDARAKIVEIEATIAAAQTKLQEIGE